MRMKNHYENPELEIVEVNVESGIATTLEDPKEGPEIEW